MCESSHRFFCKQCFDQTCVFQRPCEPLGGEWIIELSTHGGPWGCPGGSRTTGGDAVGEARWVERSTRMQERRGAMLMAPGDELGVGVGEVTRRTSSPLTAVLTSYCHVGQLGGGMCLNSGDGPGVGRRGS